jgi:hypothetical protein
LSEQENQEAQLLSRDDLLAPATRRYTVVGPLPVRGGMVRLQSLNEQEASAYDAAKFSKGELVQARLLDANCRMITACLVDAGGNRLLGPGDVAKLLTWDRADIEFLYTAARAHITAKQRPLEDVEKNSDATPAAA